MYSYHRDADLPAEPPIDISEPFRHLLRDFDLHYFVFATFPRGNLSGLSDNLIATNWPPGLLYRFDQSQVLYRSRFMAELRRSVLPVFADNGWHNRKKDSDREPVVQSGISENLADTMGIALHDADHRQYLVLLSGPSRPIDDARIGQLIFRAMKIVDGYLPPARATVSPLSGRELDCLGWSAAGKSSEEIAVILALSTHTVNEYLKAAMRKLNAVSRTQAVAIACRLRLI